MIRFLKRLFGGQTAQPVPTPAGAASSDRADGSTTGAGRTLAQRAPVPHGRGSRRVLDYYFELSATIERAKADGDYRSAIAAARETYPILKDVVRQMKREYGSFDIVTSHAVHTAPCLMAVLEDRESIRELRTVLETIPTLREWLPAAVQAEEDVEFVVGIMAEVHREPGLVQSSLKRRLGAADGRRLSLLAKWLETAGRIRRVRKGSSQRLYPPGHQVPSTPEGGTSAPESTASASHQRAEEKADRPAPSTQSTTPVLRKRQRRPACPAQEIDLEALPYVRLPKAPARWEERRKRDEGDDPERRRGRREDPRFAVEGEGWQILTEDKLPADERPDPSYKEVFPTGGSTFWLDPRGHRDGFENAAAVLRVTDRAGALAAERGLAHDVYRSDVNTSGSAILFMSREGVLHGYSDQIEQVLGGWVEDLPEYRAQAKRLGIESRELRNHVRCVAVSADRSRYLVTVVDEGWCLSTTTREVLWGLRLPLQEGWTKVASPRTDRSGTSAEVAAALRLMELELPVAPDDVTRQYRQLAMRWHPDRNPGDSGATRQFQELAAAMELLTGTDLLEIDDQELENVTYARILSREQIDVAVGGTPGDAFGLEVTMSVNVPEKNAADWIYAANFALSDNRAFLAGYSGKVVEVSERGTPVRAYDLGAVPRHIAETLSHLYFLTDTRLYVVSEDRLEALVDVFDKGALVVGDTGFGLVEPKTFSWFTPTGRRVGGVRTRDPIRRVFSAPHGLVIETRQHRATVAGAPSWWRG